MNKKTKFLLLLIGISFFGCQSANPPIPVISNIDTDFPTSEKLEFKPFNKYAILDKGGCMIDDSVLWYFSWYDNDNIGFCYDLNTAEKLSTIAMKGKADHEFIQYNFYYSKLTSDSLQLYTGLKTIKTFAKKDIIENKPMNERGFSVTTLPDSISTIKFTKLPNGSAVAMIQGSLGKNPLPEQYNINNKSIAIINDHDVKGFETINYDSFDVVISESQDYEPNFVIKNAYGTGEIAIRDNNLAAFSVRYQFILYTLDLNKGNVIREKRYTKMQSDGSSMTTNDMEISLKSMKSKEKYIYCLVSGYFSNEDKESKQQKKALFVFDWDLNPVKRFDLPNEENIQHILSTDCKSIYIAEYAEEGLILTKADLTI